jgi:hypothetical protein
VGEHSFDKNCEDSFESAKLGGKTDLYYMSKGTRVHLVKNLTLRGSKENPRSFPREEKSTSPYLLFIYYKLQKRK